MLKLVAMHLLQVYWILMFRLLLLTENQWLLSRNRKSNPDLKPERTKSIEAGLEMSFFQSRLGFDLALYKSNTINQIMPVSVSYATGYSSKYVNAGEIQNKGIELRLMGTPVKSCRVSMGYYFELGQEHQ